MKASITGRTFALAVCLASCASTGQQAHGPEGGSPIERRDLTIVHEPCDHEDERAVARDANRDGRPDLITVSEGGRRVCQWLDLNFDGVVDAWVYFDESGQVRRRETDYDRDGRIDEIAVFRGGQLESRKRATTLAGRLDTWEYFENGKLVRAERDSDGNALVDQWWEYPRAQRQECPVVHSDVDGDGRPDPGATVDLCADEMSQEQAAADVMQAPPTTEPGQEGAGDVQDGDSDVDAAPAGAAVSPAETGDSSATTATSAETRSDGEESP